MTEPSADTVFSVPESRLQRDGLYGLLAAAFLAAGVRGALGASTSGGRVGALVVFGLILGVVVAGWLRAVRHPDHLEVTSTTIRYVSGAGRQTGAERRPTLSRRAGGELRFVGGGGGRFRSLAVAQSATGVVLPVRMFSRGPIKEACESAGWTFVRPP